MYQEGLGLIIGSVSHCYCPGTHSLSYLSKEGVAHLSGRLLKRGPASRLIGFYVSFLDGSGDTKFPRQIRYVFRISIRFRTPQLVIQMGYMQIKAEFIPQLE
jgi:hypothetical protein